MYCLSYPREMSSILPSNTLTNLSGYFGELLLDVLDDLKRSVMLKLDDHAVIDEDDDGEEVVVASVAVRRRASRLFCAEEAAVAAASAAACFAFASLYADLALTTC